MYPNRGYGKGIEAEVLPRISKAHQIEVSENRQKLQQEVVSGCISSKNISACIMVIEVDSKGTKVVNFRIYLPTHLADDHQPPEEESESKATAPFGNRKTILLVEDNEEFRQFMYRQLSQKYQGMGSFQWRRGRNYRQRKGSGYSSK